MAEKNRRENFIRLAENRVGKTLKDIRLIGNLSNKSNYSYKKEDINKIFNALDKEIRLLKKRFEESDIDEDIEFKL